MSCRGTKKRVSGPFYYNPFFDAPRGKERRDAKSEKRVLESRSEASQKKQRLCHFEYVWHPRLLSILRSKIGGFGSRPDLIREG